jgi:hypothetical protein
MMSIDPTDFPGDYLDVTWEIMQERIRQLRDEGHTPSQDDNLVGGELAMAAVAYAMDPDTRCFLHANGIATWPLDGEPNHKTRRQDLIRAAALLVAEIERIDRAAKP